MGLGIDSGMMWQEVSLLRKCKHPRVVQLLGVAVQVSCCLRHVPAWQALAGALAAHARTALGALAGCPCYPLPQLPEQYTLGRRCVQRPNAGGAAAGRHGAGGARQPPRPAPGRGHAGGAALGRAVRGTGRRAQLRSAWPIACGSGCLQAGCWQPAAHAPRVFAAETSSPALPNPPTTCRGRQVALDVAEALDYLHSELRVLHSDLKAA